ncbi:MAG TPA: GNAT family N-acetyltransferase [Candidatus Limnocylindrales bacterium]|nr:GNAT family N-acetyltransferase [Candidatus Limnocylindrales bacterium]
MSDVVRRAVVADAEAIATIHVASWRAAYSGIVPQSFLDGLDIQRRATGWGERLTAQGDTRSWVAERDGKVVGFAGTDPAEAADVPHVPLGSHALSTIYTLPETWGTGVGRALLERVEADLAADGVETMYLWVFASNDRARAFYERAGWQLDGGTQDLAIGGASIPTVRYVRSLKAASEG